MLQLPCPWDSPGKNTGVGCHFLLEDLPDTGIKPRSPTLQADSFLSEPPGAPKQLAEHLKADFTAHPQPLIPLDPTISMTPEGNF